MTAAIGMSRMIAARSMSLTTRTSFWSQRSTNVPAIGQRNRFGRAATKNDERRASGEPVDREHERGQRELVDPVAEQPDELAGPERRERAVEGEADVRVAADPLDRLGRTRVGTVIVPRDRRTIGFELEGRGRRQAGAALPRTSWSLEGGGSGEGRRQARSRRPVACSQSAGSRRCRRVVADGRLARSSRLAAGRGRRSRTGRSRARAVRNTSPIEATFWTIGNGIGMMSPSGPRWRRKSASSSGPRMTWMAEVTSPGSRPASDRGSAPRSACSRR